MSESSVVHVLAPSRLHFGMFSFGNLRRRQFGGVGTMIEQPGLELHITPASEFQVEGPVCNRVHDFARRWAEWLGVELPRRRIEVVSAPPQHVGLGVGTQLALAVGAGLNASFGRETMTPEELTTCMGRGQRSAVGAYGFFLGGLVIEEGKAPGERLAPIKERILLPPQWRFLLIRPQSSEGLSGQEERDAFRALPSVPEPVTQRLWSIVQERLAPAARGGDFAEFSESLYEFGHEAGLCFAARQGGAYASALLERWVTGLRRHGVAGVGQSSWGPTLFALFPNHDAAATLAQDLQKLLGAEPLEWRIAAPNRVGARIVRVE